MSERMPTISRATMTTDKADDLMSFKAWKELRDAERARWLRVAILFAILVVVLIIGVLVS